MGESAKKNGNYKMVNVCRRQVGSPYSSFGKVKNMFVWGGSAVMRD